MIARVRALAGAAHLGPSLVVTAIAVLLAVAAGALPVAVVLLGLGVFTGQLSVGWANDWLDADLDRAAARTDKPAATGAVAPSTLRTAALVALVPGLALPFGASLAAGGLHVLFVASAWSYDLGLKRTPASVLPYVVSFGALPAIAALAARPPAWPAGWTLAAGAVLGVAAHFANVVPDADADRAAGVRGLPQRLGSRGSAITAALALVAGVGVVALGSARQAGDAGLARIVLVLALLCALAALGLGLLGRSTRLPFRLVMAAALLLVVVLLLVPSALR